jgi:hypothetical protein
MAHGGSASHAYSQLAVWACRPRRVWRAEALRCEKVSPVSGHRLGALLMFG